MEVYEARVLSCSAVDGDTLRCTVDLGWRINAHVVLRLAGIDTPEREGASLICAQFVKVQVEKWLAHAMANPSWRMRLTSSSIDMYGRSLGYLLVRRGEVSHGLSTWLLSHSYAKRITGTKRHTWVESELITALTTDAVLPDLT